MQDIALFQMALGLAPPWLVANSSFSLEQGQLDIHLDFPRGSTFPCPCCGGAGCKAYDTEELTWRHLNFFQYKAYLHARTPRIECPQCGVKRVNVPWARAGSGFTLLLEAMVMTLVKVMPVHTVAKLIGEHDTRIWRIVHHYVDSARAAQDYSLVSKIGVDETAARRGHDYVSLFVDHDQRKVLFATPGKDGSTVAAFAEDLQVHGGKPDAIKQVSSDLSPAFISGVTKHLPHAEITFDPFHVTKLVNEAVDKVRRAEQQQHPELRKTRYLWLKNPANLTVGQTQRLEDFDLPNSTLKTARAYQLRLAFQSFYDQPREQAKVYLKKWYFWATHSRLEPMIEVAKTIKRHWNGILRWSETKISNGLLEGINSLVQAAKAKARGYRSHRNFIAIIYLVAGKLSLELPT